MDTIKNIIIGILTIIVITGIFISMNRVEYFDSENMNDSIYTTKPFVVKNIKPSHIDKPEVTIIHPVDTSLRQEVVAGDVVVGVEKKKHVLTVSKIDTKGIVYESKYDLPVFHSYAIDTAGNVRIRRRFWPYVAGGIAVVGLGLFGILKLKRL